MPDPDQQHEEMRQILSRWVEIPDDLWASFAIVFKSRRVREKEHVIRPHDRFDEIFFVNRGLLRIYYLSADGKEFNKSFISERMFAGSFASYNGISEISCGVQALEDSVLLAAEYRHFAAFYDRHHIFDRLGRMALEWLLVRKERREQSFLLSSAKERFQDFAREHPELVRRVPQYHLASYLGITEVSLSRLKRELS
jgi:CRP-like cAMP-binding protein